MLIFFDGTEDSLTGILQILEEFRQISGLKINRHKAELLLDGGSSSRCRDLATAMGMAQGALPLCYMGVPLSPKKMTRSDFQPLIDKIAFLLMDSQAFVLRGQVSANPGSDLLQYLLLGFNVYNPCGVCGHFRANVRGLSLEWRSKFS